MCVNGGGMVYNSEKFEVMTSIFLKNNIASKVIFLKAKKAILRVSQGPL